MTIRIPTFSRIVLLCLLALAPARAGTMINVTDHGAVPNSGQDATPAFKLAIAAAAAAAKPVTLLVPPGRYDFLSTQATRRNCYFSNATETGAPLRTIAMDVTDINDLTISAEGATLMMGGRMTMMAVERCERFTVRGATFDFARPTVSEITCLEKGTDYWIGSVHPDSGYQLQGSTIRWVGEDWNDTHNMVQPYDPVTRTTWRGGDPTSGASSIQDLGNRQLRFSVGAAALGNAVVGRTYQFRHTRRDETGIWFSRCKDVALEDVAVRFMHGFGLLAQFTENLNFERLTVAPDPASGRTCAAAADIMHFSNCKGLIRVHNSTLTAAHDDAVNIHGTHLQIVGTPAANQIQVRFKHHQSWGFQAYQPGDQIEFVRKATLQPYATRTVTAVSFTPGSYDQTLTLDSNNPAGITLNSDVVENITWTPSAEFVNCDVALVPTRGFLLTTRQSVLVEGCRFFRTPMHAILCEGDGSSWYESGPMRNLTLRRNSFFECAESVVQISPNISSFGGPVHSNVVIQDNDFTLKGNGAVYSKATDGLSMTGNRFRMRNNTTPVQTSLVGTSNTTGLQVTGNTVEVATTPAVVVTNGGFELPDIAPTATGVPAAWSVAGSAEIVGEGASAASPPSQFLAVSAGASAFQSLGPYDPVQGSLLNWSLKQVRRTDTNTGSDAFELRFYAWNGVYDPATGAPSTSGMQLLGAAAPITPLGSLTTRTVQGALDLTDVPAGTRIWMEIRATGASQALLDGVSASAANGATQAATLNHEWKFENNVNDTSGSGNHGTITGTASYVAGRWGQAINLPAGAANHVEDAAAVGLPTGGTTAWSMNLWVNLATTPTAAHNYLAGFGETAGAASKAGRGIITYTSPNHRLTFWDAAANYESGYTFTPGAWTMVTLTFDGASTGKYYVNGVLNHTFTDSLASALAKVNVGKSPWGNYFVGKTVDEFTVWSGALTPAEITSLYDTNTLPAFSTAGCWNGTGGATWDAAGTASWSLNANTAPLSSGTFDTAMAASSGVATFGNQYYDNASAVPVTQNNLTIAAGGVSCTTVNVSSSSVAYTFNGADATGITGTTDLTKSGSSMLTLAGANTHTGATTVSAGSIRLGNGSALASSPVTLSVANGLSFAPGIGTFTLGNLTGASLALTDIASAAVTLQVGDASNTSYGGNLSGTGSSLMKQGGGTLTLTGGCSMTGAVTVNAGNLTTHGPAADGVFPNASSVTINTGGTLISGANGLFGYNSHPVPVTVNAGGTLTVDGGTGGGPNIFGTLTLAGGTVAENNSIHPTYGSYNFGGASIIATGTTTSTLSARDFQFRNAATTVQVDAGSILNVTGYFTGLAHATTMTLNKTGAGTLILASATASSHGPTNVNGGTLQLSGFHGAGKITVAAGATLTGTGTTSGVVEVRENGFLTMADNATGELKAGATTVNGTYQCQIDGAACDTLTITGNLTFGAESTIAFSTLPGGATAQTYVIASHTGTRDGTPRITGMPGGYSLDLAAPNQIRIVKPPGYSSWAAANAGGQAADRDYDGDGVANGIEYFMGLTGPAVTAGPAVNGLTVSWAKGASYTGVYGTDYRVETSTSLAVGSWTPVPAGDAALNDGRPLQYTLPGSHPLIFTRLVVTGP